MKKTLAFAFIIIIILLCLVPFFGMLFYNSENAGAAEQRTLAEFPKLIEEGTINLSFGSEFEDWFADHFAFRSELVNANSVLREKIFSTSSEDDVIIGKNGWLFYTETLEDFLGEEVLTEGQIEKLATVIRLERDFACEKGAGYVFAVAPNKNSIYPEMMPGIYGSAGKSSLLDRVNAAVSEAGVTVCDLKKALTAAKNEGQLYYKGDSHWNLLGSSVAYEALCKAIFSETEVEITVNSPSAENLSDGEREDDLLKMLHPLAATMEEKFSADNVSENYKTVGRMKSVDDAVIRTTCETGCDTKVLMFRDSFGRALIKPFSNTFSAVTYVRGTPFNIYDNTDENTVVIREIVERNIEKLLETAPVATAGIINLYVPEDNVTRDFVLETETLSNGLIHYFGCVPDENYNDALNYNIYIVAEDGVREAFPITESGFEGMRGYGFSFYAEEELDFGVYVKK